MAVHRCLTLCLLWLGLASLAFSQQNLGSLTKFQATLAQEGFNVQPGHSMSLDLWQQYCSGVITSASYNNKGAPYLTAIVPHLPGDTSLIPYAFQLRADEAIVFIGISSPQRKLGWHSLRSCITG